MCPHTRAAPRAARRATRDPARPPPYMCPHATMHVSSCYYICVLMLLYVSSYESACARRGGRAGSHVARRAQARVVSGSSRNYMCPYTTIYMCPYTTIYVSSYVSSHYSDCSRRATRDPARPPPPMLAMLAQIHDLKRYSVCSLYWYKSTNTDADSRSKIKKVLPPRRLLGAVSRT